MVQSEQTKPATPNDYFRIIRRMYFLTVGTGLGLFALAVLLLANRIGHQAISAVLMGVSILPLIGARFVKAGAACPQCQSSLLWHKARFGLGHASFGEKTHCPNCQLDLNQPWTPPEPDAAEADAIPSIRPVDPLDASSTGSVPNVASSPKPSKDSA